MKELYIYLQEHDLLSKIFTSGIIIILNVIAVNLTNRLLFKTVRNNTTYYNARKRFNYFYIGVTLILILIIWSGSKLDLATYVGFISAGIAISLRELFTNIAAWWIIIFQKPFEVGDRIVINNQCGDVIDIKLFQFVLMEVSNPEKGEQSTGRIVNVPNNHLFTHGITNATKGFDYLWNEIEVHLTLESDWHEAKELLETIINEHALHLSSEAEEKVYEASRKYMIHYQNLTPIVYVNVRESMVVLTIRYLCEPRQARITENLIWQEILTAFENSGKIHLK